MTLPGSGAEDHVAARGGLEPALAASVTVRLLL